MVANKLLWKTRRRRKHYGGTQLHDTKHPSPRREGHVGNTPPYVQARMLELLAVADPGNMAFWNEALRLNTPDSPDALAPPLRISIRYQSEQVVDIGAGDGQTVRSG